MPQLWYGSIHRGLGPNHAARSLAMTAHALSLRFLDNSPPPDIDESLTRAQRFVSDQVGLISNVSFIEPAPDEPAIYFVQSRPARFGPLAGRSALNVGNATSIDRKRAIIKAVGETVERYCSAF